MIPNSKFHVVAIAGTFDRLHKGHRYFIQQAFRLGHKVIIGLTSDYYVKEKLKAQSSKLKAKVENYINRKRELERFLREKGLLEIAKIVKIDDIYGPAIRWADRRENEIEALAVTDETFSGGLAVNKKREELGLPLLKLLKLPMIFAQDDKRIASTRIRIGEIDRWGKVFELGIRNYESGISDRLRSELKKPIGKLIPGDPLNLHQAAVKLKEIVAKTNPTIISTVGDEVTKLCNEIGITISLAIVDFKVHREEKYHNLEELGFNLSLRSASWRRSNLYRSPRPDVTSGLTMTNVTLVKNPPGHITKELVNAVKNAYLGIIRDGKQRIIQVFGEEDLAGVPAVLLAPLGSIVFYGQPGEGVVVVEVTEERKNILLELINQFSI